MPVAAALIIPTLADRLAFRTPTDEVDRDAHAEGQGGVQRVEQRGEGAALPFTF